MTYRGPSSTLDNGRPPHSLWTADPGTHLCALYHDVAELERTAAAFVGSGLADFRALHVAVPDADATWRRALDAGATEFEPLHDAFRGMRTGQFIDPFGHRWAVDQHLRDVPHEEVARLAAAFGAGSS